MAINDIEHCEHTEVHAETVQAVREHMPAEDELYDLAELFKVFGDSTRIRILFALFEADICVCDLTSAADIKERKAGQEQKGRQAGHLFSGRRTCQIHHQSGS